LTRRIDDRTEAKNVESKVLSKWRPVQRIVRILGRLWREDKIRVIASTMFQVGSLTLRVTSNLIEEYRTRYVREDFVIFENSETHFTCFLLTENRRSEDEIKGLIHREESGAFSFPRGVSERGDRKTKYRVDPAKPEDPAKTSGRTGGPDQVTRSVRCRNSL